MDNQDWIKYCFLSSCDKNGKNFYIVKWRLLGIIDTLSCCEQHTLEDYQSSMRFLHIDIDLIKPISEDELVIFHVLND